MNYYTTNGMNEWILMNWWIITLKVRMNVWMNEWMHINELVNYYTTNRINEWMNIGELVNYYTTNGINAYWWIGELLHDW